MSRRVACVLLFCAALALGAKYSKVRLSEVRVIALRTGEMTAGRRSSPVPQMQCIGAYCNEVQISTAMCTNMGSDGRDVQWKCEAEMPNSHRFGKVDVSCEGYDYPDDPYILVGSCGLEYRLERTGLPTRAERERERQLELERERLRQRAAASSSSSSSIDEENLRAKYAHPHAASGKSSSSWGLLFVILVVAAFFYFLCGSSGSGSGGNNGGGGGRNDTPPPYPGSGARAGPSNNSGSGSGSNSGGSGASGDNSSTSRRGSGSSSPFAKDQFWNRSGAQEAETAAAGAGAGNSGPGFWTGAALGAGLGYLARAATSSAAGPTTSTNYNNLDNLNSDIYHSRYSDTSAGAGSTTSTSYFRQPSVSRQPSATSSYNSSSYDSSGSSSSSYDSGSSNSSSEDTHTSTAYASTKRR